MSVKLALIYSISGLIPLFDGLCEELLPDVKRFHIADEAVLQMMWEAQEVTPAICRRVCDDVIAAEEAGADVVLVTCSSISPCVDAANQLANVPVLKVDSAMVDKAISTGARIGVAATANTTLKPTTDLIRHRAQEMGKQVTVDPLLCKGAYDALFAGDQAQHDQIVRDHLYTLMDRNDVVILAQASMGRVAEQISAGDRRVPILASPKLAIERISEIIKDL